MCLWKPECLERLLLKIYLYAHELVVYAEQTSLHSSGWKNVWFVELQISTK